MADEKFATSEAASLAYGPATVGEPSVESLDDILTKMLQGNATWSEEMMRKDPKYFEQLKQGQRPHTLWIGCSDSRVPANTVTGTSSGEIFVHRNIANTVIHTDSSLLSVLQFAVDVLEVKHIIVCGHQCCGGVTAALTNKSCGLVDNWLRHIQTTYHLHRAEIDAIEDFEEKVARMTELHVQEGVINICRNSVIHEKWKRLRHEGQMEYPHVHGWVYSLENGRIKDIGVNVRGREDLKRVVFHPKEVPTSPTPNDH
mmetsp:Transcript_35342/g.80760  ORF Transcript_35342/g.80760 Transcript_35342/m.80760 type:complete len:257 (+) Transcript_35342:57-827(+)